MGLFLKDDKGYDVPRGWKKNENDIEIVETDSEGLALLLRTVPLPVLPDKGKKDKPATAERPHGRLLWLQVNTHTLKCQRDALQTLV